METQRGPDPMREEALRGGSTVVRRSGDLVLRESRPWSPTVIALLRHLEDVGFMASPRVVGEGFDQQGREVLAFIDGERADVTGWSDAGAAAVGALLRDLHRATASFSPPADAVWMPWWGRDLPGKVDVIGHCDAVPWNFLSRDGMPVGLLDWDTAGPVGGTWELAQAAWLNAQLYGDDATQARDLPDVATRARRLRLIVDGYGLARAARRRFVDAMIEFAVRSAAQETVDGGVSPTTTTPAAMGLLGGGAPLQGHDLLWAITWRLRSAAWIMRHRPQLEAALR